VLINALRVEPELGTPAGADAGDPAAAKHAGIAKLSGTRAAITAVEQAVALVGNNGLTRRYPLERHYRDVLCDIDRVLALTASRGITVTHVFETHIHNDYVTGGLALARATGAAYHVNAADSVAFDRVPIAGGDVVPVGTSMRVRAIATPRAYVHAPGLRA